MAVAFGGWRAAPAPRGWRDGFAVFQVARTLRLQWTAMDDYPRMAAIAKRDWQEMLDDARLYETAQRTAASGNGIARCQRLGYPIGRVFLVHVNRNYLANGT